MLAALLAVSIAHACDPLNQDIVFERPAMPLKRLLPLLSEEAGLSLSAHDSVREHVVLLHIRRGSVREAMDALAEATHARWFQQDGKHVLRRPAELQAQLEREELQLRAERVRAAIAELTPRIEGAFDEQAAKSLLQRLISMRQRISQSDGDWNAQGAYEALWQEGPMMRALLKLVKSIPPEELGSIRNPERRVYKVDPTKMQRPFGPGAREVLEQLATDLALWSRITGSAEIPALNRGEIVSDPLATRGSSLPQDLSRLAVIVTDGFGGQGPFCNLTILDGNEHVLAQLHLPTFRRSTVFDLAYAPAAKTPQSRVALSQESEALVQVIKRVMGQPDGSKVAQVDAGAILDPVAHDPISFLPQDVVMGLANDSESNVAAWIPDDQFAALAFLLLNRQLTLDEAEVAITADPGGLRLERRSGWLIGRPSLPLEAIRTAVGREALHSAIQSIRRDGRMTLLNSATFAAAQPRDDRGISFLYLSAFDNAYRSMLDANNRNVLRLYGSLTGPQREALEQGATQIFSTLQAPVRQVIHDLTYGSSLRNQEVIDANSFGRRHPVLEPTEFLPNGVPRDALLSIKKEERSIIVAFQRGEDGEHRAFRPMDANAIAYMVVQKESSSGQPSASPEIDGFALGTQRVLRVRVTYSPVAWHEFPLIENWFMPGSKPSPWKELPADIRTQIETMIEHYRAQRQPPAKRGDPPPSP
jgi:hypothetical protein